MGDVARKEDAEAEVEGGAEAEVEIEEKGEKEEKEARSSRRRVFLVTVCSVGLAAALRW